ncbi:MAG: sugar transferase [Flavobacteriaceae bacterium]|nr:sugar transferase [Flavobacteriaceae bacterium]
MYINWFKPSIDFVLALTGLVIGAPLLFILTLILFIANRGTPFFLQNRPGKNKKLFKIIKFKTMNDATDAHGNLLPDEQRITRIGALIRKSSLDELLQLINILKGDMSLVGPRPLLSEYLDQYMPTQARRHEVKPGITGWAQVNGRNSISWAQKWAHDVWYVDNISCWLDMSILFKTIVKVLKMEGINTIA